MWFSSSSETCCTVPIPVELQSSLPGLALASAISPGTVFASKALLACSVVGATMARKTGSRSLRVS